MEEESEQNAEEGEGAQDKKMKGERMKNEQGKEATGEMRTKHGTDPRAFGLFLIL